MSATAILICKNNKKHFLHFPHIIHRRTSSIYIYGSGSLLRNTVLEKEKKFKVAGKYNFGQKVCLYTDNPLLKSFNNGLSV